MRIFSAVIFWSAILLLILWIGVPFIADISGLILTDKRLSNFYHSTRYIVVPAAFLLTLFKTLKKGNTWHVELRTVLLTLGAASFSVLYFMTGFFEGLCGSTTKDTLFVNREQPSSQIVLREFGCGAASAGERDEIVRIDTVFGIFIRENEVDTTSLDRSIWIRQPDSE
jgi:hypothetical protein